MRSIDYDEVRLVFVINVSRDEVIFDIFKHGSKSSCIEYLRLLVATEVDGFRIAPSLNVEDAIVSPAVFIISDQQSLRITRKSRFTGSRKTKENT